MPPSANGGAAPAPSSFRGLALFPFQRRAIEAIFSGRSVLVAAPTGAGKTLVADYAIEQALGQQRRVVYTSPIKALSNQKFRDFRAHYGEESVGLMTGDVTIAPGSPLLVMTTEIFRNTVFEDPGRLDGFDFVVFDEVHYLDDRERGTVWEEAIIFAPQHIRVVALSATVPNVRDLARWIGEVRHVPVDVIEETHRPVPLTHKVWIPGRGPRNLDEVKRHFVEIGRIRDRRERHARGGRPRGPSRKAQARVLEEAGAELVTFLRSRDLLPAIYFCFSRRDCESLARRHAMTEFLTPAGRREMLAMFDDLAARYEVTDAESTAHLRALAANGVLYHHAGMLPIDKEIVERLFTSGLVRLLFATETFALGVNMPARSVCFHTLAKFDGLRFGPLLAREYWQMAGRAGRQGIDEKGWVFALLDETAIRYDDLVYFQSGRSEPVRSRFNLNYSAILNLFRRVGEAVPQAWERSLARFELEQRARTRSQDGRGARRGPRASSGARLIEARLRVLRAFHYVEGEDLTRKGTMCAHVNGYEIAVTEAYEGGWLFRCDAVQAAMLFASIVYESRPSDESARATRSLKGVQVPFQAHMATFAAEERAAGIRDETRGPDFGIAGPVQLWAEGMEFDRVLDHTTLSAGDLVRVLRMSIQLLRQAVHALPRGDPCIPVLEEARARIDRDVVDARRQLELG